MRQEKQLLLDEIKVKIESSTGFIMTKYQGLNAAAARELRMTLAAVDSEFEVVNKRIFLKALEKSGVKVDGIKLQGHIGIMFTSTEAANLAKTAVKFSENNADMLTFVGGMVDNQLCSAEEISQLAKLPSLTELRAQFVGLLQAPMSQTVGTMQAALASLLYCCEAKCNKE